MEVRFTDNVLRHKLRVVNTAKADDIKGDGNQAEWEYRIPSVDLINHF